MKSPLVLFKACMAVLIFGLASCTSNENDLGSMLQTPDEVFVHNDLRIKSWKSPAIEERETQPKQKLEILLTGPRQHPRRWLKLCQGESFEGLTLESVDISGDAIGDPKIGLAPVLVEDFSLKIVDGVPKQYLILRDFSGGDAVVFYSDEAHPPLKH
ncbi:hypothetical protein [Prosthecobacter vanneervenii]|uniref:Lipoprotein n=1 Tax=Prosthecobacter vanneervenii TaxID=48466 RepID=A0A7W8DKK6_9BACT|nr:hypothetical protein [Prosthecobacter vanneervenii]MBB5033227.1 hypothetical protein [Prosthecobacter vanneervenii]